MTNLLYLIFPIIVWTISQTIKFGLRLFQQDIPVQLKDLFWVYVWAGGSPSTHTAILTSSLVLIWHRFRFSPISTFCTAVTMLWLYDMVSDRKRSEMLSAYFTQSDSPTLQKIVQDGYFLDLSGHTSSEIVWGALLGIVLGILASLFLQLYQKKEA